MSRLTIAAQGSAILLAVCALFALASVLQVPWLFEQGVYEQYTANILEHGDYNLVGQRERDDPSNWIVTKSGNSTDNMLPGLSIYLAPFFAYYGAGKSSSPPNHDPSRFLAAHTLAVVFYVLLASIIFWRALAGRVPHLRKSLLLGALATPFLWHFLFVSTNPNILGLAYSALAFAYYALARGRGPVRLDYGVFGIIFGVGIALRPELVWTGALPLLLWAERRRISVGELGAWLAGAVIPCAGNLLNNVYRLGGVHDFFFMQYSLSSDWTTSGPLLWSAAKYNLFGPNGYFYVAPIWFMAMIALIAGVGRRLDFGPGWWCIALAPLSIAVSQILTSFNQDTLAGRHFLEFQFFLTLILAGMFTALETRSRRWLKIGILLAALLGAWQMAATASYLWADHVDFDGWYLTRQITWNHALSGASLIREMLGNPGRWAHAFRAVAGAFPAIVILWGILFAALTFSMEKVRRGLIAFFGLSAATFLLFAAMNVIHHDANVESYRRAGLYDGKVVGRSRLSYHYTGFVEQSRSTIRYYLSEGRCDLARAMVMRLNRFLATLKTDIDQDPLGFTRDLERGIVRPSAFEDPKVVEQLGEKLREKCGLTITAQL